MNEKSPLPTSRELQGRFDRNENKSGYLRYIQLVKNKKRKGNNHMQYNEKKSYL